MDSNSKKILKFLCKNKNNRYNFITISKQFPKIPKSYIIEIIHNLYKSDYIQYVSDSTFRITNKGETYFSVVNSNWISNHIIEILSLVISFIALLISIIALVVSMVS